MDFNVSDTMSAVRYLFEKHMPKQSAVAQAANLSERKTPQSVTKHDERELARMHDEGLSQNEIYRRTGRGYSIIRRAIARYATRPIRPACRKGVKVAAPAATNTAGNPAV